MYLNWMQYFDKQKQFKFVNLALSTGRNILITKTIEFCSSFLECYNRFS
jgi:hypothetical protein